MYIKAEGVDDVLKLCVGVYDTDSLLTQLNEYKLVSEGGTHWKK